MHEISAAARDAVPRHRGAAPPDRRYRQRRREFDDVSSTAVVYALVLSMSWSPSFAGFSLVMPVF
jgi:hypothetical protein